MNKYLPDLAFYRVNKFDLKKKVSTNKKYLPNIAFCRADRLGLKKKVSMNEKNTYLMLLFIEWTDLI